MSINLNSSTYRHRHRISTLPNIPERPRTSRSRPNAFAPFAFAVAVASFTSLASHHSHSDLSHHSNHTPHTRFASALPSIGLDMCSIFIFLVPLALASFAYARFDY